MKTNPCGVTTVRDLGMIFLTVVMKKFSSV